MSPAFAALRRDKEDYFECRRCGMHLLTRCPAARQSRRQEKLVCSECHIVFGVLVPNSRRNKRVICWLIRASHLGKGVTKIA